jgi:hypothetical protein
VIDPTGLDFVSEYTKNLRTTNRFFFQGPTRLSRTAVGLVTAGAVAKTFGTVTPLQAILSLPAGGIATLGALGTVGAAALNTALNALLSGIALEAGIGFGSLVSAIPVYGTDQTITDWWADFWWDLFHDERSGPCP